MQSIDKEPLLDKKEVIFIKRTSIEIEKKVCQDYQTGNYSSRELGIKYSLSKTCILKILERYNIPKINRRLVNNNLDVHYFDNIDTEEKAYFLGFIFADGSISNDEFFLDINEKDIEILLRIREEIHSNCKITTRKKGNSMMSRIAIKNKVFCSSLSQYGIIENKTKMTSHLPVEKIPTIFYKDFLRGLIDGDGWVIKTKQNLYKIGYVTQYYSTALDFVEMLNSLLEEKWKNKILTPKDRYAIVNIQKQSIVKQVALVLYKGNKICLSRKFQMAQEIFDSNCR
ncbi:MAG: hypothetical protein MR911_10295 [Spirochaetia bacterium]|nr:hypothetical protein [Spirochaetia bacterium]